MDKSRVQWGDIKRKLPARQSGLTTTEYAIAGALLALTLVGAFTSLGESVGSSINRVESFITQ